MTHTRSYCIGGKGRAGSQAQTLVHYLTVVQLGLTQRRKRFNPLDYLTAYLYRHNRKYGDREDVTLENIPFVKEEWAKK